MPPRFRYIVLNGKSFYPSRLALSFLFLFFMSKLLYSYINEYGLIQIGIHLNASLPGNVMRPTILFPLNQKQDVESNEDIICLISNR